MKKSDLMNPIVYLSRGQRLHQALQACVVAGLMLALHVVAVAGPLNGVGLGDPLTYPAATVHKPETQPMLGIAMAGGALVAVGPRGMIVRSTDAGLTWQQVACPLATDLVQVRFVDAREGWIVGHDATLLHSTDAGISWTVQLDGKRLLSLLNSVYHQRASAGDETATDMLQEIRLTMRTSADADVLPLPLFDVRFNTAGEGFVVGAFGLVLHSRDHGATWEPWIERTDNDRRLHLYAIDGQGDEVFIAGEQGLLMRLDKAAGRFVALQSPYNGTFFGVHVRDGLLLAFGLRGNLWASHDQGGSWRQVETGQQSSLVGAFDQGTTGIALLAQNGQILSLDTATLTLAQQRTHVKGEAFAAVQSGRSGGLAITHFNGVEVLDTAQASNGKQ